MVAGILDTRQRNLMYAHRQNGRGMQKTLRRLGRKAYTSLRSIAKNNKVRNIAWNTYKNYLAPIVKEQVGNVIGTENAEYLENLGKTIARNNNWSVRKIGNSALNQTGTQLMKRVDANKDAVQVVKDLQKIANNEDDKYDLISDILKETAIDVGNEKKGSGKRKRGRPRKQ